MTLWVDNQLPPAIAPWIATTFTIECRHVRGTPLHTEDDAVIFQALRQPGVVILSKDEDFADLVTRLDAPPQVLWIRVGNTSNRALKEYFTLTLPRAIELLKRGEPLVELLEASQ
ncbi:MAG TPA: DUF5615 family PIN-like protein [Phycisphaerales bacterium]|nr:DUF5615 family PIN-like protein [Phycisphaerales bacterium]